MIWFGLFLALGYIAGKLIDRAVARERLRIEYADLLPTTRTVRPRGVSVTITANGKVKV